MKEGERYSDFSECDKVHEGIGLNGLGGEFNDEKR